MKAKFTRVGKRSLSVILTLMMIVSTMLVGMVSVGAIDPVADGYYRLLFTVANTNTTYNNNLNLNYNDGKGNWSNPSATKIGEYNNNIVFYLDVPTTINNSTKIEINSKSSNWKEITGITSNIKDGYIFKIDGSNNISTQEPIDIVNFSATDNVNVNSPVTLSASYSSVVTSNVTYTYTDQNSNVLLTTTESSGTWTPSTAGTYTITCSATDGYITKTSSTTKTVEVSGSSVIDKKYYVAGTYDLTGDSWKVNGFQMKDDDGDGIFTATFESKQFTTEKSTYQFKITDGSSWFDANSSNISGVKCEVGVQDSNYYITFDEESNITISYNSNTGSDNGKIVVTATPTTSTYSITVTQATGGNITVTDESGTAISNYNSVAEGTKFKVNAVADGNHVLSSVSVKNGDNALTATDGVYTMPAANVTVTATFTDKSSDTPTAKYALCGGIGAGWGTYDANYLVDTHDTTVDAANNYIFKRQVTITEPKYFRLVTSDKTQYKPEGTSQGSDFDVLSNNATSYANKKPTETGDGGDFYISSAGTYTIYVDQSGTTPYVWVVKETVTVTYTVNAQSNDTNMGTVSPASQTCNSGGSVSFTASVNSGYVFAGWYDSISCTNKIGSELKLTLSNVTADKTVYAKFESSAKPVKVYATDGINSLGDTTVDGYTADSSNTNTDYNLYSITPGEVITISTQLTENAAKANYYVYAFVINGETVSANNMGSGKYTASYTVGSEDLEITPIYFNQTIKDNGDYITFYADAEEVLEKWGNTVACYAYYYDGTIVDSKPGAFEDAAYPGQPMLKNSQGQFFTVVPRYYYEYSASEGTITKKIKEGTEYYPITGVTLNNYYANGCIHANFLTDDQKNYLQSFDYNDFKYIADKKDADGNPLYDTIWFDNKYRTYSESNKTYVGTLAVGNTKSTLISDIEGRNGWDDFYDGVDENTANKVGLLGDRDIDTNLAPLYVVSVGNVNDSSLGEWSVNWYVFDSTGKLLVIAHPSAFIDETSSAYKLISGADGTTDYSKNPVKITFETADTRNDGRWYYANSKKVDPYNIEVFAQYKNENGDYLDCTNKNSDTTLPFVCDTYGFSVSIDGQAVKTYTEINHTAELKVNTLPDGWIFDGWGYIRTSDGVYVPFSSTDSLQTITLSGAGKFVARFSPVPKGSVALSHTMYDGPNASKGDGVRYIKAVLTDADGNTNVYDFTTGTIQIPDVTKDCKITVYLKTVCTGINEFQTWYELVDGEYQIIGGEESDQGKTGTVEYYWDITGADLFVGDKLTYSTLNFYSDIASKTANAVLTYKYFDRFNTEKSYVVTVTLTPDEIADSFKPSNDTIYANAPAITDIYKNCIWKLTDSTRVSYAGSNATIKAVHVDTTYTVTINDEKAKNPKDVITDIALNSYLKKNDQFITAADSASFKYWKVVRTDDLDREVAKCFSPTFNLVIADNYTITAVYDGKASSSVTIGDANYTREQYTDASGKPVDRLYADFIVAYMNQSHTKITDNPGKYHTGIIIEVDAKAKITVGEDGKPSNYKEVEFTSVNIEDCATGTGTGADIKADGYANVVTIDDGGGNSHKRIIYKHEIDNTKYNNFNRLDYFVSFKNTPSNRLFVMKATYYVYYTGDNGEIVYEESLPVYFNLYDIGTSAVVTDK